MNQKLVLVTAMLGAILLIMRVVIGAHRHRTVFMKLIHLTMRGLSNAFRFPIIEINLRLTITLASILNAYMSVTPYIIRFACYFMGMLLVVKIVDSNGSLTSCLTAFFTMAVIGEIEFALFKYGYQKTQLAKESNDLKRTA